MTDRLPIAAARPGLRVVCVDPWPPLKYTQTYTIAATYNASMALELREHPGRTFSTLRFVPADEQPTLAALLAERAPKFLAAVRNLYERDKRVPRYALSDTNRALMKEIELAGLIAQEPRTTFHLAAQQFQEMHNAG